MFALIKNEYIKILKKGKNWAVFALFAAFIGLMVFGQYASDKHMKEWNSLSYQKTMVEDSIKNMQDEINRNKKMIEEGKTDPYIAENMVMFEENVKHEQERLEEINKLISEGKTERDWRDELKEQKRSSESYLKEMEDYPDRFGENVESEKQRQKAEVERVDYYLDNDIRPVNMWEFNPYNIIRVLFDGLGSILLILVIAVFVGDAVSGECTPPTLKFLVIQPVSRGKILFAKFFTSVTSILFAILSCQLITFIGVGLVKGFDAGKSIVEYGVKYQLNPMKLEGGKPIIEKVAGSGEMITLNEFTIKVILMQVLFILAVSAVIFLISTVIKNNLVSMALSVILLVIMNVISGMSSIGEKVGHLLFTNYGNITSLLTGDLAEWQRNPSMTIQTAIIVMSVVIIASYVVAHIVFKKKDILI